MYHDSVELAVQAIKGEALENIETNSCGNKISHATSN
jgi:hypothetical protein